MAPRKRQLRYLAAAKADLERLKGDDPRLADRARAHLKLLEDGRQDGLPLELLPRYGDLSDCRKIYFGVTNEPTHRIVYHQSEDGGVEIAEIVAIESRPEGYVYLLAASRLGRLPDESKPRFMDLHQKKIGERSRRQRPPGPTRKR